MTAVSTTNGVRTGTCLRTAEMLRTVAALRTLKDFYMPQNSVVGAEDGDSFEYNKCCKDTYMPQDSVGAKDGDSCEYNMRYH